MSTYIVEVLESTSAPVRIAAATEHQLFESIEAHLKSRRLLTSSKVTTHVVGAGRLRFTQPIDRARTHVLHVTYRKDQA